MAPLVATALIAALAGAPGEDAPGADKDPHEDAARLLQQGVERRYQGREEEAYDLFARADRIAPSPRAKGQMALAAKSLRRFVEAERLLEAALAAKDDGWVSDNHSTLEQALALVRRQLAWLLIEEARDGAELSINGRPHGAVARGDRVRVPAGEVIVELRAAGFRPWRDAVTIPAGTTRALAAKLEPAPVSPPPADGSAHSQAAAAAVATARWRTAALVAGGVGLLGIAAGSTFGLRALSLRAERDAKCPDELCPTAEGIELDREGRRMGVASTVAFGVGIAGTAAAALLLLSGRATSPPRGTGVRVTFAPVASGLALAGRFGL